MSFPMVLRRLFRNKKPPQKWRKRSLARAIQIPPWYGTSAGYISSALDTERFSPETYWTDWVLRKLCVCVCRASNERRLRRIDQIDDDRKASKQKISDWCIRAQRAPSADLVAVEKAAVSSLERWNTASLALNATSTLLHTENQIWLE
jgi:hypothetical protein